MQYDIYLILASTIIYLLTTNGLFHNIYICFNLDCLLRIYIYIYINFGSASVDFMDCESYKPVALYYVHPINPSTKYQKPPKQSYVLEVISPGYPQVGRLAVLTHCLALTLPRHYKLSSSLNNFPPLCTCMYLHIDTLFNVQKVDLCTPLSMEVYSASAPSLKRDSPLT